MLIDVRVKTFLEVARCGSFSGAGKALWLSAVSVMKQVESLEKELGVTLFERSNRGVTLTAAGLALEQEATQLERLADAAVGRVRAEAGMPTVRVGTSPLRPCKPLVDIWTRVGAGLPFDVRIVPFEDAGLLGPDPLGTGIDCFVGPCDAPSWKKTCGILELGHYLCMVGVPLTHRLASRASLTWDDLKGERLVLVREGSSPVMDAIRSDALAHGGVEVEDAPGFYTLDTFNACVQQGCLMETLDAWEGVHPGMVTLPMEWDYSVPYGIVHAKDPSPGLARFIGEIAGARASS